MSKKSKAQRDRRKNKKLKNTRPAMPSTAHTLADPTDRHTALRSLVRQIPPEMKSALVSRCGSPEQVTFLLLADPSERFDGRMFQWPLFPKDNAVVLVTDGASDKVAFLVGTIVSKEHEGETEEMPSAVNNRQSVN